MFFSDFIRLFLRIKHYYLVKNLVSHTATFHTFLNEIQSTKLDLLFVD